LEKINLGGDGENGPATAKKKYSAAEMDGT
jgi:hypothetical protein